jgi:thiol:disulfide interchange protein DsbC
MNPDLLVAGAARGEGTQAPPRERPRPEPVSSVDLSALPAEGAIRWGPASGHRVTVFTDFQCSYCQKLHGDLKSLGVRVEERPISVLGTRPLSEAVYCAKDQPRALEAAYRGDPAAPARRPDCDTAGLDANEAFARRNGFAGTPVLVRADGTALVGYRPAAEIAAWLNEGSRAASARANGTGRFSQ